MTEPETPTPPSPTKTEIINSIAKALAERRKARGLSLDKVFQNIKIRIPYLEAIEKGQWDELPGQVYVRGFIKRYADHIGMDGEKLMAPYLQLEKTPEKKAEYAPILKGAELTRIQLIGIGLAAIVVVILIKLLQHDNPVPKAPPAPAAAQPAATATTPSAAMLAPVVPAERHQLEVFSPLPLWLRVSAKDKAFEGFIPQGATWTWKGEGTFSVRFGHTQQLVVHFDGKPVAVPDDQKKIELP